MPDLRAFTFGNARRRRVVLQRTQPPDAAVDLTDETWRLNLDTETGNKRFNYAPASAEVCDRLITVQAGEDWQSTIRASGKKGERVTLRLVDDQTGVPVSAIRPELPADGSITRTGEFSI